MHLEVTLTDPETGASEQLVDADVGAIPEDEAAAMLVGLPDVGPEVHLHFVSVSSTLSGCLRLDGVVTRVGEDVPLYTGQAFVPVR